MDRKMIKTPWKGLVIAFLIIIVGIVMTFTTLFVYKDSIAEPAFIGRLLFIIGVIFLGGLGVYILKLKNYAFLFVVLLAIIADIGIERAAVSTKVSTLKRKLIIENDSLKATIIKVNKSRYRKGNPRKYPYIVCKYKINSKEYYQLFRIDLSDTFKVDQTIELYYYPKNPRISTIDSTLIDSIETKSK